MVTFFLSLLYLTVVDGLVYNATKSEWYDLEPKKVMTMPSDMDEPYKQYNPEYGEFSGLLFAGELEFTWIVDITSDDLDPSFSSVGNLISRDRVLTACRLFRLMERKPKELSQLKVQYCMQNTKETPERPVSSLGNIMSVTDMLAGSRKVIKVWHHPECIPTSHEHDLSLIELDSKIIPYNPLLCFAPIPIDKYTAHILDHDLSIMNENKMVCYVASFGRDYANYPDPITEAYKTKIRAYYVRWANCLDAWDQICNKTEELACKTESAEPIEIMCFDTRAKVGSVCDHDRGAPLVCQGEIMGIVERGALSSFCSNVLHLPFVVTRIRDFGWIFKSEIYQDNQIYGQLSYDFDTIMPANVSPVTDIPMPHGGKTQHRLEIALILGLLAFFLLVFST